MIDKIIALLKKHFSWWAYQPQDERETNIYYEAYRRSFFTYIYCSIIILDFIMLVPEFIMPLIEKIQSSSLLFIFISISLLSLIIGSTAFNKQEITFKKISNKTKTFDKVSMTIAIITLAIFLIKQTMV